MEGVGVVRERVTMADVARAAGVSSATVAYVLSGRRAVAPETRTAVEAAIAELGFVVDTAARSLRSGRPSPVALIVPDVANPFFAQLAATLTEIYEDIRTAGAARPPVPAAGTGRRRPERRPVHRSRRRPDGGGPVPPSARLTHRSGCGA
ncbi:LacI family DNA-binding transcriptional regulator [Streptomyces griseoluteus]|uniref:LacI family DNA-binding transcriptional regulator n=1 Tax=Streptomyces griseoluteus TaxID=29306 RepID=UPI0036B6A05C